MQHITKLLRIYSLFWKKDLHGRKISLKFISLFFQVKQNASNEGTVRSDSELLGWYFVLMCSPIRLEKGERITAQELSFAIGDHFTGLITCYREYLLKSNYRISIRNFAHMQVLDIWKSQFEAIHLSLNNEFSPKLEFLSIGGMLLIFLEF